MFAYCNNRPGNGFDPNGAVDFIWDVTYDGSGNLDDNISTLYGYSTDCSVSGGGSIDLYSDVGTSSYYYTSPQSGCYDSSLSSYSDPNCYSYSTYYPEYDAATQLVGGGHGSAIHSERIDVKIAEFNSSGLYSTIYGNRALSTAGLIGNQRPDIIAIRFDGSVEVWEFASASQAGGAGLKALQDKINIMKALNPGVDFKEIVPWDLTK